MNLYQNDYAPEEPSMETISKAARYLANGKVVGWYQGHGEIGPRALGNRSILFDPRIDNGRDIVNAIKNREEFRPFGASCLGPYTTGLFQIENKDPYMLYTSKVLGKLPSITHVDGTCRLQTVDEPGPFKRLLEEFLTLTGCPVLLNTSLNLAGKPIAGHPDDARELFRTTSIDVMVIGNEINCKQGATICHT
jgi:carbamoyltransferase